MAEQYSREQVNEVIRVADLVRDTQPSWAESLRVTANLALSALDAQWVPVAERLPGLEHVLCWSGFPPAISCDHIGDGIFVHGCIPYHATHWMPLPAAPQGAKHG